ncbi:MAG: CDP-glycerol glycerophosphotransferase family protein [Nitrososphaera sp.]
MFCRLYFFWSSGDWSNILDHLGDIPEPYQIVTDKFELYEFLHKNGKRCRTLRMIFPEEGQITYEAYRNAKRMENEYRDCLKPVTFRGIEVYNGLESVMLDHLILFSKAKRVLENNVNTIFIFEAFLFTYFSIMKEAIEMGYESEMEIFQLRGSKVDSIKPETSQDFMDYRKRLRDLLKVYLPRLSFRRRKMSRPAMKHKLSFHSLPTYRLRLRKIAIPSVRPKFQALLSMIERKPRYSMPSGIFRVVKNDGQVSVVFDYAALSQISKAVGENFRFAGKVTGGFVRVLGWVIVQVAQGASMATSDAIRALAGFTSEVGRSLGATIAEAVRISLEPVLEMLRGMANAIAGVGRIIDTIFSFIGRRFVFKAFSFMNLETTKLILAQVDKKIENTDVKTNAYRAFFLATNPEDIYLKSVYPVMDRLKYEKVAFQTFVIDLTTAQVLAKRDIPFVNFFEEVDAMTEQIAKSDEGRKVHDKVIQIAEKNNLSVLVLEQVSNYMLREIYRTCAIAAVAEHVIRLMDLRSVVVAVDGQTYTNTVTSVAKKLRIPNYFIPSTIINANPLHANMYHAEKICMYGLQGYETFMKLGYDRRRVVLTGAPKYDHLKKLDPEETKKVLEKTQGIDSTKKLIVIGMARWHEKDEEWMADLIKFCNMNGYEIAIKVHPTYKVTWREESERKIQSISERCAGLRFLITYDVDLYTLLASADLVITEYSNVGAEAVMLEKPLLTVNFINESFENEQRYHDYGAAIYIDEYTALEDVVTEIFEQGMHLEELERGRKKMNDMYNYYNDGMASKRICDLITKHRIDNEVFVKS